MPSTMAASRAFAAGTMIARFAASPRFERDRQHALDRADRAIERELADKTETVERVALDFFRGRDHAERDRQIEARAFLFDIGRREIDRGPPARPKIAAVADRGRDPIAAFLHRRIRQSDDHDVGIAVGGVDLDLDFVSIDAEDGGGVDPGEHDARLAEDFAEVQARVSGFFVASQQRAIQPLTNQPGIMPDKLNQNQPDPEPFDCHACARRELLV